MIYSIWPGYEPRIYLATDTPAVRAEAAASKFGRFIAPLPRHIRPAEELSRAPLRRHDMLIGLTFAVLL